MFCDAEWGRDRSVQGGGVKRRNPAKKKKNKKTNGGPGGDRREKRFLDKEKKSGRNVAEASRGKGCAIGGSSGSRHMRLGSRTEMGKGKSQYPPLGDHRWEPKPKRTEYERKETQQTWQNFATEETRLRLRISRQRVVYSSGNPQPRRVEISGRK